MHVVNPTTNQVYIIVDKATHERAMDALRHRDDKLSIRRGVEDLEAGRYSPAIKAFARLDAGFEAKHGG